MRTGAILPLLPNDPAKAQMSSLDTKNGKKGNGELGLLPVRTTKSRLRCSCTGTARIPAQQPSQVTNVSYFSDTAVTVTLPAKVF